VRSVTFAVRLVAVVLLAGILAGASTAAPPGAAKRFVAFVTITGEGKVWSFPQGIACPRTCRSQWAQGTRIRLVATAAPGWKFLGFSSQWCPQARWSCRVYLVSPHDCDTGMCPIGAFGVRAAFARRT
jgi:hypothetical protein